MRTVSFAQAAEEVKSSLDIVEVVRRHVILKKSGSGYVGCCPFHKEKTPSFHVNPARGIFKCFGCGEGGNAITFLMKITNSSYPDVIRSEAAALGLEIKEASYSDNGYVEKRKGAEEALKRAAQFYFERLQNSPDAELARNYLKNRGISDETVKEYMLGYAPGNFDELQKHLKDIKPEYLEAAGLIVKTENSNTFRDRFRARLIIPIFDERGNVVAFGARALKEGQNPKYLNSPDTILYNKSKILYGIHKAKEAMRTEDFVLICEGYFDVISVQTAGIKNAVASCGTSLTKEHVGMMAKYCPSKKIYLAFDTDAAGQKATERSAGLIKEAFEGLGQIKSFDESFLPVSADKYACEIRVVVPPDGKDPDEYIREYGAEAYIKYIKNAPLLLDYELDKLIESCDMTPTGKLKTVKKILVLTEEIENPLIQNEYIRKISAKLDIYEDLLRKELRNVKHSNSINTGNLKKNVTISSNLLEKAQKKIFSLFFTHVSFEKRQKLAEFIKSEPSVSGSLVKIKDNIDTLLRNEINDTSEIFSNDEEAANIITELMCKADEESVTDDNFDEIFDACLAGLDKIKTELERRELKKKSKEVNNNEIDSVNYQVQLREKLKKRKSENNK